MRFRLPIVSSRRHTRTSRHASPPFPTPVDNLGVVRHAVLMRRDFSGAGRGALGMRAGPKGVYATRLTAKVVTVEW